MLVSQICSSAWKPRKSAARRGQRDAEVGRPGGPHQGDAHRQERAADVAHEVRVEGARVGHRRRQVRVPVHRAHQSSTGRWRCSPGRSPGRASRSRSRRLSFTSSSSRLPSAHAFLRRRRAPRHRAIDASCSTPLARAARVSLAKERLMWPAFRPSLKKGLARGVDELDALAARRAGLRHVRVSKRFVFEADGRGFESLLACED